MRSAVIADGLVVNVIVGSIPGAIECPPEVGVGWSYENDAFVAPPAPEPAPVDLLSHLADARWRFEAGGISVGGVHVATDRQSQALINGAYNLVGAMPDQVIRFKSTAGWVNLDAAAMTTIAIAVGQHVQAAFSLEAEIAAQIEAGTITTAEEIDAAFTAA